jgi:hypothetical protein
MVQRVITQTRWRPPSCFREYFWDGAVLSRINMWIKHGKSRLYGYRDTELITKTVTWLTLPTMEKLYQYLDFRDEKSYKFVFV